ncbi:MAG: DM13 domain-containing protein [Acidimicrobiales bacterium]
MGVPFVGVTYWLVEPYFVDDKVDDEFVTSIEDASRAAEAPAPVEEAPVATTQPEAPTPTQALPPAEPVLLGAGTFRGLAGHDGTGDAGFFSLPDGSRVLRLENFDIQNGPDLRLYVVPGADQTDPTDDSLYLGDLRGNVGDQTYDIPADFALAPGPWTILVWCEAFSVEFVAATVSVT